MKFGNLKLINSLVFFVIIWATQCLVNSEKSVSFEQHVQVQQELSQLIAAYVKENLPEMTNFKMYSVYTKPPRKGFMDAYFNYSFTTNVANSAQQATTELAGVAVLRKVKDEPQEWALEKIEIEGESLTFSEPVVITPTKDGSALTEEAASTTPAAEPKEEKPAPAPTPAPKKETPAPAAPATTTPTPTEPAPTAPKTEAPTETRQ